MPPASPHPCEILVVTPWLAPPGGDVLPVAEKLAQELQGRGSFRCVRVASGFGNLVRLGRAVGAADTVWLHDTLDPACVLAFLLARARRKPVIITCHGGAVPWRDPLRRAAARWADRLATEPMLRAATLTIFDSDRVAEDYYRRVRFAAPVKIIPNGVDLRLFHAPMLEKRRYLRQQFALRPDQPVLLFRGRFARREGLDVVRHMAELMPAARFWLAGEGPMDPARWMLPNVHAFRDRSGEALAELYHAADLLVAPGLAEGFPCSIQQALASGLPVLCSPATAAGSQLAGHLLHQAEAWPGDPRRTADHWVQALKRLPLRLPLAGPQLDLADFAQAVWDWGPIAEAHADIFREMQAPPP
jgi:glycosyltransferase involved in cell wall biosynthesis